MKKNWKQELIQKWDKSVSYTFQGNKADIYYYDEITTTMEFANKMARDNCPNGTIIVAKKQNKGHGRLKRTWHSSKGGLYFTMVLRPDLSISSSFKINYAASLSIALILQKLFEIPAKVKWPNDVLVHGKKISGMISEMSADSQKIHYINIGIGINVNNDPQSYEPKAISIKNIIKHSITIDTVLQAFLKEFEKQSDNIDNKNIISKWKDINCTLGNQVKIVTSEKTFEGQAIDIDETGALIIKQNNGCLKHVIYGDCFHNESYYS